MPLQLQPAKYEDMDEIVGVIYAANADPHDPFMDLCLPGLAADSKVRRTRGERQMANEYLEDWNNSDTVHWLKVVDSETGKIVSAASWEIFQEDPFEEASDQEVDWLPKGSRVREYAEFLINARKAQSAKYSQCPHASLDVCATLPKYRRRGAASLMLQWGIDRADELGVKAIIEATVDGRKLYERFGFSVKDIIDVKKEGMEGDAEWMELRQKYPLVCCWMERPPK